MVANRSKPFSCSFRDVDGTEWSFRLYANSFNDAERRLKLLKESAVLDGEVRAEWPANGRPSVLPWVAVGASCGVAIGLGFALWIATR